MGDPSSILGSERKGKAMSANNQVVVVQRESGWEVWLDYCVDNAFPISAKKTSRFETLEMAVLAADAIIKNDVVEYGMIIIRKGGIESFKEGYLEFVDKWSAQGPFNDWPFDLKKGSQ